MPLRHLYSVRHNDHRILPILYLLGSEVSYSMDDKGKRLALTAWNSEREIYRLRSSCSAKYRTWGKAGSTVGRHGDQITSFLLRLLQDLRCRHPRLQSSS